MDGLRLVQPVGQREGGALPAAVSPAGVVATLLAALRSIDAVQTDPLPCDFYRVTINDRGPANDRLRLGHDCRQA